MRTSTLRLLAAALLAGGAVAALSACSDGRVADQPTVPATQPADPSGGTPITPPSSAHRAPLGLEVRYLDENGTFATLAPEDFPR